MSKIEKLIAMKSDIESKKDEVHTLYIPSLDMDFKYKKATRVELLRMSKMEQEDIDLYGIFSHVIEPNLGDKALQEAYNKGKTPYMIVDELLPNVKEVSTLSSAIAGNETPIDALKSLTNDIKN